MHTILRRSLLVAFALVAVTPLVAQAQEQVTVVRRGGQRIAGRFDDWNRQTDTVYIRVSQSDQQKFAMADVQVMAVGGSVDNLPANEVQAARGPDHILVTRGGELLRGRLTPEEHDRECDLVRDWLGAAGKPHLGEFLQAWNAAAG